MPNFLPNPRDRVKVTGPLPNDPAPVPVGATGTVTHVWNAQGILSAQLSVRWDPPHQGRTLMLLGDDPFVVEFVAPDAPEWQPHNSIGERFGLDDQPTTCPHCGSRTEESDNPDRSQNHTCLRCGFRFVGDWEDWDDDEDDDDEDDDDEEDG